MNNWELISCVLDGLDVNYDLVINTIHIIVEILTFEIVYNMLLNREKQLEAYHNSSNDHPLRYFLLQKVVVVVTASITTVDITMAQVVLGECTWSR